MDKQGKLTICPTPLGNLGDVSERSAAALRACDVVCCEDTRVTGRLLAALGIEGKRLERMDETAMRMPAQGTRGQNGNAGQTAAEALVERVLAGENVVFCSDAGMPGVSDPGAYLVTAARAAGAPVEVLPGPSAAVTAYVASGFSCPHFYFGGFFPRKASERTFALEGLTRLDAAVIFYENPHRLASCLAAVADVFPERAVCVCRELTKLHEEVVLGPAPELAAQFAQRSADGEIKGEVVVVIDAPGPGKGARDADDALRNATEEASRLLGEGALSKRDIVERLQDQFGIPRNDAYALVHGL